MFIIFLDNSFLHDNNDSFLFPDSVLSLLELSKQMKL